VGTSLGPSFLIHPSFSRPGGVEAHAWAQGTLILRDSVGRRPAVLAVNVAAAKVEEVGGGQPGAYVLTGCL
jgi:hypothetical protein